MEHFAFISIGSNMGDKLYNCRRAVESLNLIENLSVDSVSKYYKTEPVDYLDQDWFVNLAVKIKTCLEPYNLLKELNYIEKLLGSRKKEVRFGPRILDLDIIFYDDIIINTKELKIPHPRMHERRFVLKPLCDIEPDFIHPVIKMRLENILFGLDENCQKVLEIR